MLRQLIAADGLVVPLSGAEFRLLWVFIERPRRVLSREQLLDAALRYAGQALITLEDHREELLIRVIDHGPGIAAEQREAVFEPFFRLEGSRNRNSGGVGLGMTIAREAAERLGGQLSLEENPKGGLAAIIRLPRV